jgi:hypothetical protein
MNNSCFRAGQVGNLSGQDAILSYDYFCDAITSHARVNKITGCTPEEGEK